MELQNKKLIAALTIFAWLALLLDSVPARGGPGVTCPPGPWNAGVQMPDPRNGIGCAKDLQGRIYIPGGNLGSGPSGPNVAQQAVMRFVESTGLWESLPDLNTPRNNLAVASDRDGRIYAIGGTSTAETNLASVERLDPGNLVAGWSLTDVPPLPGPLAGARAVTDRLGRIYVVGGYDAANEALQSVLVFNPANSGAGWQHHSDMLNARNSFGLAIDSQDRLYAIGGASNGGSQLSSVERCDIATGVWSFVATIDSTRAIGTAVADCNDFIYAIGGWEPGYTCKVQRFNPSTEQWESFAPIGHCRNNMAGIAGDSGKIYTFGGDASFASTTTVEFFQCCAPLPDTDADGIADIRDNCPLNSNPDQANCDGDSEGDACDPDTDNDSVPNAQDACLCTPAGVPVDCQGRPRFDANGDCRVDGVDIGPIVQILLGLPG